MKRTISHASSEDKDLGSDVPRSIARPVTFKRVKKSRNERGVVEFGDSNIDLTLSQESSSSGESIRTTPQTPTVPDTPVTKISYSKDVGNHLGTGLMYKYMAEGNQKYYVVERKLTQMAVNMDTMMNRLCQLETRMNQVDSRLKKTEMLLQKLLSNLYAKQLMSQQ